jgi:hypothetical protein
MKTLFVALVALVAVSAVGCGGQKNTRTTTLGGSAAVSGGSVAYATTSVTRAQVPVPAPAPATNVGHQEVVVKVNVTQSGSITYTPHAQVISPSPVIRSSASTVVGEHYGGPNSGITIYRPAPVVQQVYVQPVQVEPVYVQQPVYYEQPVIVERPVYYEQPSTVYYTVPGASFSAGASAVFGGYDNTPYWRTDNSCVERGEIRHTQSLYGFGGRSGGNCYPSPVHLPSTRRCDQLPGLVHHPSQYGGGYQRQGSQSRSAPAPRGRH